MMREMSLCRVEELKLRITHELRPALALGDPALAFGDRGHGSSVAAALRHSARPPRSRHLGAGPGVHERARFRFAVGDTFP